MEKRTIAGEAFSYGKRSFFLDFMVARTGSNYIQITKRELENDGSFTTRRLAVFMDDFEWLISGFSSLLHSAAHAGDKACSVHALFSQPKQEKGQSGIEGWDPALRPRERLAELGAQALETKELIGSGSREASAVELAQKLLCSAGGDLQKLSLLSLSELSSFKGMGTGKCCAVLSAIELSRRIHSPLPKFGF
ncbi:UPF0758 domain-containing protein [Pedobacter endophyticus]|uniref:UPF0758 domain-containing protein n=1 Tax=Pedobacter endophyticus TaxID=2789740 RepID=A0A7S9L181_9SPHI|nr:UPF0758 domain-containing protein [Pedobacter endophyticus]QPH40543.1 hypothetical protein IZT61_04480 [Pedobacter endophyticus]